MSTSKAAQPDSRRTRRKPPAPATPPPAPRPERFVVLLRHGIAEERTPDKRDEDRGLTAEGHARMKQVARGLERVFPRVQTVCSSTLLRAVQTSLWVSKAYRSRVQVTTNEALVPGAPVAAVLALVDSLDARRIILVGHEPGLSDAMRALTGLDSARTMELKKGGAYGIRVLPDGTALLEWVLPPRVLRNIQ